jgi:hypothetical protein
MVIRIVQYLQPWEIDDFHRQVEIMIQSKYYIQNKDIKIIWDVTLNTNCVDWTESSLPLEYFINKFKFLENLVSIYFTAEFDCDNTINGSADKRRNCVNKEQDHTIWLDSDLFFSKYTLSSILDERVHSIISEKEFIITPNIIKYWDDSWDIIVHPDFINESFDHRSYFDLYSIDKFFEDKNKIVELVKINKIKFGGGWFTLLSDPLLKRIGVPIEIGEYGPDDTYIIICSLYLNIPQYILRNIIVSELGGKYLQHRDYIKNCLKINHTSIRPNIDIIELAKNNMKDQNKR